MKCRNKCGRRRIFKKRYFRLRKRHGEFGGNVYAKFIENANVTAKKNVYSSSIIHSNIECYDSIIVKDAKGVLYGGLVRAANKITAQSIGSHAHAVTTLEVGIMPDTRDEFNKLSSEAQRLQKNFLIFQYNRHVGYSP